MKKKKKAFTLVELLAVIVVLAIILIIAIPRILDVIHASRLSSIESSAKLIAKNAENYYLAEKAKDSNYNETSIECNLVAEVSDDYGSCTVKFDSTGRATLKVKGASGSKYAGLKCTGTKDGMTCSETSPDSKDWVYAYHDITDPEEGVKNYHQINEKQFIRFNEDDLTERYVCTLLGGTPTCISANAYATRNDANSEWKAMKTLFTSYAGKKGCKEQNSTAVCTYGSTWLYKCETASTYSMCYYDDDNSYYRCYLYTDGTIDCR